MSNPSLYQVIGKNATIDIEIEGLGQDNFIKLSQEGNDFIPLQQVFSNKVRLQFEENPKKAGIYSVLRENDTLRRIGFNYDRKESKLEYLNAELINEARTFNTIPNLFDELREDTAVTHFWKWFVIFALLFAVLELLLQKWLP